MGGQAKEDVSSTLSRVYLDQGIALDIEAEHEIPVSQSTEQQQKSESMARCFTGLSLTRRKNYASTGEASCR